MHIASENMGNIIVYFNMEMLAHTIKIMLIVIVIRQSLHSGFTDVVNLDDRQKTMDLSHKLFYFVNLWFRWFKKISFKG